MTPTMRAYSPGGHCPAESCADGKRKRDLIHLTNTRDVPAEISLRDSEALYRCPYCGLMWTQRASDSRGILRRHEARAVGHKKIGKSFEAIHPGAPFTFDEKHYREES